MQTRVTVTQLHKNALRACFTYLQSEGNFMIAAPDDFSEMFTRSAYLNIIMLFTFYRSAIELNILQYN